MNLTARARAGCVLLGSALLGACSLEAPDMVPLTEGRLDAAQARWAAAEPLTYRLAVKVSVAKVEPVLYQLSVREGAVVTATRNGQAVAPEQASDYTVSGLFGLLRSELRLIEPDASGRPAALAELFVRFASGTGRLERFKRSTTRRATGLRVEVLEYAAGGAAVSAR